MNEDIEFETATPPPLPNLFYGTSGPHDARIAIVGESWGSSEARKHRPFVGMTGDELTKILAECGISRAACFITNVVPQQPPGNEMLWFFEATKTAREQNHYPVRGLYPKENVLCGLELLRQQLAIVKPDIIIGFGNYTLWALTDNDFIIKDKKGHKVPTGIGSWRGSQLYCTPEMGGFRFLPTYHPAAIFRTWAWRYDIVHDLKARVPLALADNWNPPDYNFIIQPSFSETMRVLAELKSKSFQAPLLLSEDIETSYGFISCIGFAWNKHEAICIPFNKHSGESYWTEEEEIAIILAIRDLHKNPSVGIVGQNFLYDAQYYVLQLGFIPNCVADTMLLHHLCWPGKPKSLAYICSLYNSFYKFWKEEGKIRHPTFSDQQHWTYNCLDAVNTYEANTHLQKMIDFLNLREQATERNDVFALALDMMIRGVRIDLIARATLAKELNILLEEKKLWLKNILPQDVFPTQAKKAPWFTSPKQQAELFYDILGMKEIFGKGKRGTAGRTCNDEALTILSNREPVLLPIIQTLQEIRSLKIFKTNFVECQLDDDNRLRCSYDPSGTKTFRWNSRENAFGHGTNLQNIPAGTEEN